MRRLIGLLCLLAAASVAGGCSAGEKEEKMPDLKGKKVVLIAALKDYRDEELEKPKAILEKAGAVVKIASSAKGRMSGMLKGTAEAEIELKDLKTDGFDAVIFIGGAGAKQFWKDETCHKLARTAAESGKVVGAICIAPVTLANAGVLKGKQAAVFAGCESHLEQGGARVVKNDVVTDGKIVTANGPAAAEKFGKAVAALLAGPEKEKTGEETKDQQNGT